VLAVGAWHSARFAEHRRGGIDSVDALGKPREADRERSCPGSRVKDGPRFDEQPFEDFEDLARVWPTVSVVADNFGVQESAAKLARVRGAHSIAFSRRSSAAPTDARRLPSRSYGHSYFFTAE